MKGRRNNRRMKNQNTIEKKVVRCNLHQKPVFSDETCDNFVSKHINEGENNCKNCQQSS